MRNKNLQESQSLESLKVNVFQAVCRIDFKEHAADVPLLRMDRLVKFAQQLLNRMVVFPSSPPTLFPLEFFRLAVTVRVVTPTETQLPCRQQHRSAFTDSSSYFDTMLMRFLYFSIVYSIPSYKFNFWCQLRPDPMS